MNQNAPLKINMLGEFSITYGGKTINDQNNRSKKLWTLLEYLIAFRGREISQNELIELLWPGEERGNPANTLKTLLHRVRSLVAELGIADSKELITYRRGTYAWNNSFSAIIDVEEFDELLRRAYGPGVENESKLSLLLQAADLYKGDFLPKSSLEPWAIPICTYYHSQYLKAVHDIVAIFGEDQRFDEITAICRRASQIDPYDEQLHYHLIKSLADAGRYQEALQHYDYVTELFYKEFGINKSAELTALYTEVIKTTNSTEYDLGVIKDVLRENTSGRGGFFCEFEIFREIYQLEARAQARTGQVVHICLITVTDGKGGRPKQKNLNVTMDRLRDCIKSALRSGDACTRYSVSQFLVMLPGATFENGDMVMQRIVKKFKKDYPKLPVLLNYRLQALEPKM